MQAGAAFLATIRGRLLRDHFALFEEALGGLRFFNRRLELLVQVTNASKRCVDGG